ncbi:MAG TPA: dUTP diphosphatase [Spirochaetia bacterium]|nr:dUTP diphosphatase [Spirochaetia bacterium]
MAKVDVLIKKVRSEASLPRYESEGAAGLDLAACLDGPLTVDPGCRAMVPTGLAVALPSHLVALVFARSGLAARHGLALANGVGVVDSDYRGEVICAMVNLADGPYTIEPGDRIAQMVFVPVEQARLVLTDDLPASGRGEGGFGSTGRR